MKNRPKFVILVVVGLVWLVLLGGLSCGKSTPEGTLGGNGSDQESATEKIAEASKLYRQRGELSRVRLGIALLRQARIADYSSYEAAWKLSQFSY